MRHGCSGGSSGGGGGGGGGGNALGTFVALALAFVFFVSGLRACF